MLIQALEPSLKDLDDEDLVLYFNGRIPMIAKFSFLSYCVMFGVKSSTELEKPVLITFSIVRPPIKEESKPRDGGPFMADFSSVGPAVLPFRGLANHTRAISSQAKCVDAFQHLPMDDERCLYLGRLLREIK